MASNGPTVTVTGKHAPLVSAVRVGVAPIPVSTARGNGWRWWMWAALAGASAVMFAVLAIHGEDDLAGFALASAFLCVPLAVDARVATEPHVTIEIDVDTPVPPARPAAIILSAGVCVAVAVAAGQFRRGRQCR